MKHPPRNTLGYTPGGSRLTRHDPSAPPPPRVDGDDALLDAVEAHLDRHFPGPGDVLIPADWDGVRVVLHVRAPTAGRNFWVFMTSGMASVKMKRPHGKVDPKVRFFSELFLQVDASWPGFHFRPREPRGERFDPDVKGPHADCVWPLLTLTELAEVPYTWGLCLTPGSSIPNPAGRTYAPTTDLSGAIVYGILPDAADLPEDPSDKVVEPPFACFTCGDREVGVMQVVLVNDEEMALKVDMGPETALMLLHKVGALGPLGAERGSAMEEAERILAEAGGPPPETYETFEADPRAPFGDEPLLHGPGGYRVREDADAHAPALADLRGRWRVTMYGEGGEYAPEGVAEEMQAEVEYDGHRYTSRQHGEVVDTGRLTLEPIEDTHGDPEPARFTRLEARSDNAPPDAPPLRTVMRFFPREGNEPQEAELLTALPPGSRLPGFDYGFGTPASYARMRWAGPPREKKPKRKKRPGRARRH